MTRIDLLAPERSTIAKAALAVLHSSEVRNALLVPLLAIACVFAYNGYQRFILNGVTQTVQQQQGEYRRLLQDEQLAQLRVQNYERLEEAARRLFELRRSVVIQARHIKNIGNVVYQHQLRLSSITETGDQSDTWDLAGSTADQAADHTCFSNIAATLPVFISVKGVVSAVPEASRDTRTGVGACSYKIHLSFDEREN